MIDVLFRGKRVDNGEWIESSSIVSFAEESEGVYLTKPMTGVYTDKNGYGNLRSISSGGYDVIFYKVDPASVGVWTGEYDDNGEKVFIYGCAA